MSLVFSNVCGGVMGFFMLVIALAMSNGKGIVVVVVIKYSLA